MLRVNVYKALQVTQITPKNNKAWGVLRGMLDNPPEWAEQEENEKYSGIEGTLFDFDGVELVEPWQSEQFKKFFADTRAYLRIYTSEVTKHTIDTMCRIGGIKDGRVENVDIYSTSPKTETKEEAAIRRLTAKFHDAMKQKHMPLGIRGELNMEDIISQLGSKESVQAIAEAIKLYSQETDIKEYRVKLGMMAVLVSLIPDVARMISDLNAAGYEVEVTSTDPDISEKINIWLSMSNGRRYNEAQKVMLLTNLTPQGLVGMLTEYKVTRGTDEFGRCNGGKAVACRPAIFLGVRELKDGSHAAVFQRFRKKQFMPRLQYCLDNDGAKHPGLQWDTVHIPIRDLGIYDKYLGRLYHFMEPIQYDPEDRYTTYICDEDTASADGTGSDEEKSHIRVAHITLPEFLKLTLNDFDINYNTKALDQAIYDTDIYLRQLAISH